MKRIIITTAKAIIN